MEGQQFDRLTRSLAWRRPRRDALHVLIAGVFAGVGWRQAARPVRAQASQDAIVCAQDADCDDQDLDPCTGVTCVDGACAYFIVDCVPGYVCCGNGECCLTGQPGACLTDADCAVAGNDPCQGATCDGGTCVSFFVTCAPGFVCCGSGTCCPEGGCVSDDDCATEAAGPGARTRCISGVCVPAVSTAGPAADG